MKTQSYKLQKFVRLKKKPFHEVLEKFCYKGVFFSLHLLKLKSFKLQHHEPYMYSSTVNELLFIVVNKSMSYACYNNTNLEKVWSRTLVVVKESRFTVFNTCIWLPVSIIEQWGRLASCLLLFLNSQNIKSSGFVLSVLISKDAVYNY